MGARLQLNEHKFQDDEDEFENHAMDASDRLEVVIKGKNGPGIGKDTLEMGATLLCQEHWGFHHGRHIYEKFLLAFSYMPLAALLGQKILCVHGGISPALTKLDDIQRIRRPISTIESLGLVSDLMWAEPHDYDSFHIVQSTPHYAEHQQRPNCHYFNEAAVDECLAKIECKMLIRGSSIIPYGYRRFANDKVISIFSSSGFWKNQNSGAVLKVAEDGKIAVISLLCMTESCKKGKDQETTVPPMKL
uniref:SER_THR_PHOSPHATASE domain-containing protein n=1 Tax=Caenorhabditis japonica TaxID=281687 RepID=A0A8R1HZR0_CAEJA